MRYECVNWKCDKAFDDAEKAREHENENNLHWITDTKQHDS